MGFFDDDNIFGNDDVLKNDDVFDADDNIIVLTDDQGNDVRFEFLDLIEFEGEEYVVLLPEEGDEVVILRVESTDDDTESYTSVDDERTLMTLFEIFKEKFKDEFNFVD